MKGIFVFAALLLAFQAALALPAGWKEISPGGDTLCARGGKYKFLVYPGDPQKVLVSFSGGGACWDDFTCASNQIYTDTVEKTFGTINNQEGIYNTTSASNPYKGWTHLFIPYCTGDVHLGAKDATYTDSKGLPFTIRHRGGINTRAALEWLAKNYPNPSEVNVDGCSAGSYGSIVWTPYIAETYKNAKLFQFGDSGAGIADSLFLPTWGIESSLPAWVPGLNPSVVEWDKLSLTEVYKGIAKYYPQVRFSQFNHEQDRVQTMFYAAMGGNGLDWTQRMFQSMDDIALTTPNFRYFVAPGKTHCTIINSSLYTTKSDGVVLSDWLKTAVSGQDSQNVKCLECKSRVK